MDMEQPVESIPESEHTDQVAQSSPPPLQEPKTHVSDKETASNQPELELSAEELQKETTDKVLEKTSEQVLEEAAEKVPKERSESIPDEATGETTHPDLEDTPVQQIPEPEIDDQGAQTWDHEQEESEKMLKEESEAPLEDALSCDDPWMAKDEGVEELENQILATDADMVEEIQEVVEPEVTEPEVTEPELTEREVIEPTVLEAQKPSSALGLAQKPKRQSTIRPRLPLIQPAQIMYKAAAPVSRLQGRPCRSDFPGASVKGARMGSNRQIAEMIKTEMFYNRQACRTFWVSNSACSVPPSTKLYHSFSKLPKTAKEEEWRIREERDKERRDHELAKELGYETLVGNILYIDIPGGRDINRSWQNFLSQDLMEWGFPYQKGSIERPRMKQPEPYLAHQVKEKLWKFPRSRTFQITTDD